MIDKLQTQLQNILKLERLKECYELRLYYIRKGYALKNDMEKNEVEILELTTESEITKIDKLLNQLHLNFDFYIHKYADRN
jgi:hypothetical protein